MLFAVRCWYMGLPVLVFIPADTREDAEVILAETFDFWTMLAETGCPFPTTGTDGEVLWISLPQAIASPWPAATEHPQWSEGVHLGQYRGKGKV